MLLCQLLLGFMLRQTALGFQYLVLLVFLSCKNTDKMIKMNTGSGILSKETITTVIHFVRNLE